MVATAGRRDPTKVREERVGPFPTNSKGQDEKPLNLKMSFTEKAISLHLFLAHRVLNSCSHFSSKMSLKIFFSIFLFSSERKSQVDVNLSLTHANSPFNKEILWEVAVAAARGEIPPWKIRWGSTTESRVNIRN